MTPSGMRRDEDAVSAAVATVLLFGGVISIIGIMLLSLMPIIQELEGSLKRNDMQAQMEILGHEVTLLTESGLPGDSSQIELIPVDGEYVGTECAAGCGIQHHGMKEIHSEFKEHWTWIGISTLDIRKVMSRQFAMKI